MPEQDKEASDMQTRCRREAVAQGLYDPQLHRPEQVSILDDLVGEEASLSAVCGGAHRSHETSPGQAQTTARLTLCCYR